MVHNLYTKQANLWGLPSLETEISTVYDYSLGMPNTVADYHACLPIWYDQSLEITVKVINELKYE